MRIEIWADITNPWTHVAAERLRAAVSAGAGATAGEAAATAAAGPTDTLAAEAVAAATGATKLSADATLSAATTADPAPAPAPAPASLAANQPTAAAPDQPTADTPAEAPVAATSHEIVWRPLLADPTDPGAPRDALRLLVLAEERGGAALQGRVAEELLASHDVRDRGELVAVAERAGFEGAGALLASDAGERGLREQLLIGKALGVGVSPTLVVGEERLEFAMSAAGIAEFVAGCAGVRVPPAEVRRLRWAEALVEGGDPLGALVLLKPLMEEHGQDSNVRRLAASAYFASAQLGRAEAALEAILAERPDDSYARMMLGRTLKRQGRGAEAETHLRMAAAMTPEYA